MSVQEMSDNGELAVTGGEENADVTRDASEEQTLGNGQPVEDAPFLGTSVCQTAPQTDVNPSDYVPLTTMQQRTAAAWNMNGPGSALVDVPLELPFAQVSDGAPSDSAWMEVVPWKKEDDSVPPFAYQQCPYAYTHRGRTTSTSRLPLHPPSITGSSSAIQQRSILEANTTTHNIAFNACMSQGPRTASINRREEIHRLSQNPWGSNTIIGPQSTSTDLLRSGDLTFEPDYTLHSDTTAPYNLTRREDQSFSIYSKYRSRPGMVRRIRKRIAAIGGRICQNFFVWVLFVATLAALEGYKGNTGSRRKAQMKGDWSDSEAEPEQDSKFNVLSFKG